MALDLGALVSIAEAGRWARGYGETTDDDDAILELLVNSKSRAIQRFCGRQFAPAETEDAAKQFAYDGVRVDGEAYLSLAPWDLREVTSVVLTGETLAAYDGVGKLGSTEYRLEPINETAEETWTAIALGSCLRGYLVITGKWGAASVPPGVKEVCLEEVTAAFRNPELAQARASSDLAITFQEELAALSPAAKRALEDFRNKPLG